MERNTKTTLGQLRIGDRYNYLLRCDLWQVVSQKGKETHVNQIMFGENKLHKYDYVKRSSTEVIFLRHTLPLPGERCILCDLKAGDLFHNGDAACTQFEFIESKYPIAFVTPYNSPGTTLTFTLFAEVTFISKKEVLHESH